MSPPVVRRGGIGLLVAAALLSALPGPVRTQPHCGSARWPVKTASDEDIGAVDTLPIAVTVAQLVQIPRPGGPFLNAKRVAPFELRTFILRARMARVVVEDDSDIHLILRDLELPNIVLIAEIPSGACTSNPRFARLFEEARRALRALPRNGLVEIVGIGFFDFFHGQSGNAPNGFEIHPVLSLRVLTP